MEAGVPPQVAIFPRSSPRGQRLPVLRLHSLVVRPAVRRRVRRCGCYWGHGVRGRGSSMRSLSWYGIDGHGSPTRFETALLAWLAGQLVQGHAVVRVCHGRLRVGSRCRPPVRAGRCARDSALRGRGGVGARRYRRGGRSWSRLSACRPGWATAGGWSCAAAAASDMPYPRTDTIPGNLVSGVMGGSP